LPDDPVRCLDQAVCGAVDIGRLSEDLEGLGKEPLRRDLATVSAEPGLAHLRRDPVDVVGLRLARFKKMNGYGSK